MKFFILFLMFSCAQQQLVLQSQEVTPFTEFSKKSRTGEGLKTIAVNSVRDNREVQNEKIVGNALTGVKYSNTPIELNISAHQYLKEYMIGALIDRGFSVDDSDGVKLDVVINDLWVEELIEKYLPEKAKCKANITVYLKEGKRSWNGNYWTEIISPGDLSDGTEKLAPTLGSCLNEIVEKLANDKSFLNNLR
jgi:uncharacterized lipoprotein YajG